MSHNENNDEIIITTHGSLQNKENHDRSNHKRPRFTDDDCDDKVDDSTATATSATNAAPSMNYSSKLSSSADKKDPSDTYSSRHLYAHVARAKRIFAFTQSQFRDLLQAQAASHHNNSHNNEKSQHSVDSNHVNRNHFVVNHLHKAATQSPIVVQPPFDVDQFAREKNAQVLLLQRQLAQCKSENAALEASNEALRQGHTQLQNRLDKTSAALRIAGQNAAKARRDADQAENVASKLAASLNQHETVVKDVKAKCQKFAHEHQQVKEAVRTVETKLVHTLQHLQGATERAQEAEMEMGVWKSRFEEEKNHNLVWKDRYEQCQDNMHDLQDQLDRSNEFSQVRRDHSHQIKKKHHETLVLLEAATRNQKESNGTIQFLQEKVQELTQVVSNMSKEHVDFEAKSQRDRERLHASYTKSLSQSQRLQLEMETLSAEHAAKESEWKYQLKMANETKVLSNNSRAVEPATTTPTTSKVSNFPSLSALSKSNYLGTDAAREGTGSGSGLGGRGGSTIPAGSASAASLLMKHPSTLASSSSSPSSASPTCCICLKPAMVGLFATCQCGQAQCNLRAHVSCINRSSSSSSVHRSLHSLSSNPNPNPNNAMSSIAAPMIFCGATATSAAAAAAEITTTTSMVASVAP